MEKLEKLDKQSTTSSESKNNALKDCEQDENAKNPKYSNSLKLYQKNKLKK